jgi:hypothetical protein
LHTFSKMYYHTPIENLKLHVTSVVLISSWIYHIVITAWRRLPSIALRWPPMAWHSYPASKKPVNYFKSWNSGKNTPK